MNQRKFLLAVQQLQMQGEVNLEPIILQMTTAYMAATNVVDASSFSFGPGDNEKFVVEFLQVYKAFSEFSKGISGTANLNPMVLQMTTAYMAALNSVDGDSLNLGPKINKKFVLEFFEVYGRLNEITKQIPNYYEAGRNNPQSDKYY
jgi:hypothetical protein